MKFSHVIVWLVSSATVYGNIVYLRRQTSDSVELPCACSDIGARVFAVAVTRRWLDPIRVLYLHAEADRGSPHYAYRGRIFEKWDVGKQRVSVNITHLRGNDTDIYQCVFFHDSSAAGYGGVPGVVEFFLHVDPDEPCSCYDYKPLVYSLSAAVLLLFVCVLGCTGVFWPQKQPDNQPIYEEMWGKVPVRSAKR
uniref:Immunoglobulin V-set domain-containing protein n=1 Tax=Electrophorus electricus TaxID=8005 RepID=A0A4W4EIT8_ELEEL